MNSGRSNKIEPRATSSSGGVVFLFPLSMAKDPAFLFYPGDWNLGTMHMTILEKGAYIELLMLQFARGKFTEAQAKHMLNGSFDVAWATLKEKFETDGNFFWNKRLLNETEKRRNFTESRRNNGSVEKSSQKEPKHMLKHMENENKDENISELDIGKTIQFVKITAQRDLTPQQINEYWTAFLIHSKNETYHKKTDRIKHFRDWIKKQKENGTDKSIPVNGKHESAINLLSSIQNDLITKSGR